MERTAKREWLPEGALDCHVHVIDPASFPFSDQGGYRPSPDEVGPATELERVLEAAGVAGALLVQPSCYGTDNRALLAALAASAGRHRGIAVVSHQATLAELEGLKRAGVVGVRLNVVNMGEAALHRAGDLLGRLEKLDMVAQIQCPSKKLPKLLDSVMDSGARLVLDHLGYPDVGDEPEESGFREVCDLARREHVYVKLSGAFRLSAEPYPHSDTAPFALKILEAFGSDRCVWGSDWPFIGVAQRPTYEATLDLLPQWVPDRDDLHRILVTTPRRLFGFAEKTGER